MVKGWVLDPAWLHDPMFLVSSATLISGRMLAVELPFLSRPGAASRWQLTAVAHPDGHTTVKVRFCG